MNKNGIYIVKFSEKVVPPVFPHLPQCKENLHLLKKIEFQYPDLDDSEYNQVCKLLVENKNCYATHHNDVGNIFTLNRISMKIDAKLQTQGHTKVAIQFKEKVNASLDDMRKKCNN